MLVLVSYDVSTSDPGGPRRLRRVAKACLDYGQRVQHSVFECSIDAEQWTRLRLRLLGEIDPTKDSLRFYFLGSGERRKVEHHGAKQTTDLSGPLVV